jgi:hypothetical protein
MKAVSMLQNFSIGKLEPNLLPVNTVFCLTYCTTFTVVKELIIPHRSDARNPCLYCKGFPQSVSRQRLGKQVPTFNNERCVSVDECYSSLLGNSQRANELAGYESCDLCFLCCPCGDCITKTYCSVE